jgi:Uma2 family endonuclease
MVVQIEKRHYTPEEYLELEEKAEYKSEYRSREILPMAGGTTNHNKISLNFCRKFPLKIQDQDYEIYMGDVKLSIPHYQLYTYPDVMVVKGKPMYEGTGKKIIINPLLIVEVLSNSTKNYDKIDKFKYYRSISGFQEYILIDQYSFAIEQFAKQTEGQWIFREYEGGDAILRLDSVNFQISLGDIYERVDFGWDESDRS